MKVNASLLSRIAQSPRESWYAQKLASRIEPGQSIEFADGSRLRVQQKSASPGGMRFVVSGAEGSQTLSLRQFAALGPVSPSMRRLASFVHRVVAFDATIDSYVKEAIKAAGYPVDPSMNWAKYLDRMYIPLLKPLTQDTDLMDDAIRDTVIAELYQKKILSPDSTYAHFDPEHEALAGKELANKVSAYLVTIFKHRKEEVVNYVKRALGVGSAGNMGLVPTESLDQPGSGEGGNDEDLSNDLGSIVKPETNKDIENMEGEDEVRAFLDAFIKYITETSRESAAKTLIFITRCFESGLDRPEIRKRIIDNPKFKGRFGDPLNLDGYNFVMAQWGRLIRTFAKDPEQGWANSPIARMITRQTDRMTKTKEKKPVTTSSLRLAAIDVDEQQPNLAANTTPPPPPPNPNVQQQNAVKQQPSINGLNTAQPAPDNEDNVAGEPKKPTIPPELPGVNHTASEEKSMPAAEPKISSKHVSVEERIQQRRVARKFAKLRRIAEEEPQEVGEALSQLSDSFAELGKKLENLEDHLDVAELPKEASIRQKVAHRNTFARGLKRLAAEEPQEIQNALNDFYAELNTVVSEVETLADHLGLELDIPEDSEIDSITFKETPEEAESVETVTEQPVEQEIEL